MRRYFVCKVVDFRTTPEAPVQRLPKLLTPLPNGTARFASGTSVAVEQHPGGNWAIVVVSHPSGVPTFPGDGDIEALPDAPVDVEWAAVDRAERLRAEAGLQRVGAAVPTIAPGEGFRYFVRRVGQQCRPAFTEDGFGIPG